jgi:CTP synthase
VVAAKKHPEAAITVAMVGKYVDFRDSYISLAEALQHAGIRTRTRVNVRYIEARELEASGTACLEDVDAVLVPGGFGDRGIQGKIEAVRFARERRVPYLGICLGLQVAVIEFARNVAGMPKAHSTEFDAGTPDPVIALITEWQDRDGTTQARSAQSELGGTMRLGAQDCRLEAGTLARQLYGRDVIRERHRHRYEFNNRYLERLRDAGMVFAGFSVDGLVELIELPGHPWFVACQFHPEFKSNPRDGHPLFRGFVQAARDARARELPAVARA